MNDYKELIKALRCCGDATPSNHCDECPYEFQGEDCYHIETAAADAIEQLVKERDAAVADLKQHVYESGECFACRHYIWETDRCDRSDEAAEPDEDTRWEWRGCRRRTDES